VIFEGIVFFVAAALAVAGALGIVLLQNAFYSVLALVAHLVALATLFLLLDSAFVAAAQVVVYAGAVMVLYIFVVAYIGGGGRHMTPESGAVARLGPVFALAIFVELSVAILGSSLSALRTPGPTLPAVSTFGSPAQIGQLLLSKFLIAFEAASFVLLVAAVGAIVLGRRRRGLEDPDESDGGGVSGDHTPGEQREPAGAAA